MGAGDGLDDGQAEAHSRVVGVEAFGAPLEGLGEGRDLVGVRTSPVFSTVRTADLGPVVVVTRTVPRSGRLWTIAFCTRFVVSCSRRGWEPRVGVISPPVSTVTPCFSARGRSVSAASSATRDRSTGSRVKDHWWARLSRSRASVASIARVFTVWRRSMIRPVSWSGSARARSSRVFEIASGVRSSWEALAAKRCCSETWASSRASIVSKASASSRNSSLGPGSWMRWESEPSVASRVASVMRVSGASMRPASSHPPPRPNTSRNVSVTAAVGAKARSTARV